jgi:hypothetical protein
MAFGLSSGLWPFKAFALGLDAFALGLFPYKAFACLRPLLYGIASSRFDSLLY